MSAITNSGNYILDLQDDGVQVLRVEYDFDEPPALAAYRQRTACFAGRGWSRIFLRSDKSSPLRRNRAVIGDTLHNGAVVDVDIWYSEHNQTGNSIGVVYMYSNRQLLVRSVDCDTNSVVTSDKSFLLVPPPMGYGVGIIDNGIVAIESNGKMYTYPSNLAVTGLDSYICTDDIN